jgi:hypothetical protein
MVFYVLDFFWRESGVDFGALFEELFTIKIPTEIPTPSPTLKLKKKTYRS